MSDIRLVIFTRFPEAGKAKTRLIPALGAEGAAALHRRLTEHTVREARASHLPVELRITGAPPAAFADWLGSDLAIIDQGEGDLGERLGRAAAPTPVLFIGSDLPDLDAAHLIGSADHLRRGHTVIGPAEDGGYWALGLPQPSPYLFEDMPWSTDRLFALTLQRLRERGVEPILLPTLADCDLPEDLARWPELIALRSGG